jgi:diguanylate cyclase (GGDEF)-like protein
MPNGPRERLSLDDATLGKLRPVLDIVRKINAELSLRRVLTQILDTMVQSCNARRGTIVVFRHGKYKAKISRDRAGNDLQKSELGISHTVLKAVKLAGRRVVCTNIQTDPSFRLVDSVHSLDLLSVLCLPIQVGSKILGAFYLDNREIIGAFGPRQIEIAELLSEHAAIAVEKDLLNRRSSLDRLTKLYNHATFRKQLDKELEEARRLNQRCGVLMVDLDDFKGINDTYGHDTGNEVLKHVAQTLASTVRAGDLVARVHVKPGKPTVARFGGDEFEMILPGTGRDGTLRTGQRLVEALGGTRFQSNGHALTLSISVGGAVFPDDASTAEDLLQRADEALYVSKRGGKNRAALYRPG